MRDVTGVVSPFEEARAELAIVLGSSTFGKSPRMARLLDYLCQKYFSGRADEIKEYNIAVDLLGRPSSFDPAENAIARVEVHRLRKKLREYYDAEGADRKLRIEIPSGSYVPVFATVEPEEPAVCNTCGGEPHEICPMLLAPVEPAPPEPPPAQPRRRLLWLGGLIAAAGLVTLIIAASPVKKLGLGGGSAPTGLAGAGLAVPSGTPVRIAVGRTEPFVDQLGQRWDAEANFSGGNAYHHPVKRIGRTGDPELYESGRSGTFAYNLPVADGVYEMRLHFAETEFGPDMPAGGGDSSRTFHVVVNGHRALSDIDIFSAAGGANIAVVRTLKDISPAPDGMVHLRFLAGIGEAILSGIEFVPALPHRMNPIRITTRDTPYTDPQGRRWLPDDYWQGGRVAGGEASVQGASAPGIFTRERYGNFSYAIPVPDGVYEAAFYMAETYWGPENPGGGGEGSRVFDVLCNGTALFRNVDIYRQAGAAKPLVLRKQGLTPNAQGTLMLSFVPVRNYASIYAIEVLDTTPQ